MKNQIKQQEYCEKGDCVMGNKNLTESVFVYAAGAMILAMLGVTVYGLAGAIITGLLVS